MPNSPSVIVWKASQAVDEAEQKRKNAEARWKKKPKPDPVTPYKDLEAC